MSIYTTEDRPQVTIIDDLQTADGRFVEMTIRGLTKEEAESLGPAFLHSGAIGIKIGDGPELFYRAFPAETIAQSMTKAIRLAVKDTLGCVFTPRGIEFKDGSFHPRAERAAG